MGCEGFRVGDLLRERFCCAGRSGILFLVELDSIVESGFVVSLKFGFAETTKYTEKPKLAEIKEPDSSKKLRPAKTKKPDSSTGPNPTESNRPDSSVRSSPVKIEKPAPPAKSNPAETKNPAS